jgi:hypothetical protein
MGARFLRARGHIRKEWNLTMRTESQARCQQASLDAKSFGEINFGNALLGDLRRTKRLVQVADTLVRHPGGSLPEKMGSPAELEGLYHLIKSKTVTHESVLAPHRSVVLEKMMNHDGPVLVIHDTTELDYTGHKSLTDAGQIGNGSRRGWLCHNSLVVNPNSREVLGLASQILHRRPVVPKNESAEKKRLRLDRESRLWLEGTQTLPSDRKIIDVCDRGADTFEFLEREASSGRTFVVRSCRDRSIVPGHGDVVGQTNEETPSLLHEYARTLPQLGQWTLSVPAAKITKIVKSGKNRTSKKTFVDRKSRDAVLYVSAAPIRVGAPSHKAGEHGDLPLPLWIVRVWEPNPPEGVEALEWFLLTNHPVTLFGAAWDVVGWYECRWIVEEFHKAQKTGCCIEDPQFTDSSRLHPMIALLSVVALSLLNLRELSRREDAKLRPATDIIAPGYVQILSLWRHGHVKMEWTIHDFCFALARLGGHQNRKSDHHPGWIVLWKGWRHLQNMMDGANALKKLNKCA